MPSTCWERSPGSWAARMTIGGRQVWLGTYRSREAAEAALTRAGRGELPATMTVGDWAVRWMFVFPGRRNPNTEKHNATMIAPFARMYAQRRLSDITPMIAQGWAVAHPSQVRYLRLMFSKAKRAGIIERNVWEDVEVGTGPAAPHAARRAPTLGELEALVRAARSRYGDRVADMLVFTAFTGVRLSEMADAQAGDMYPGGRRLLVRGKRRPGEADPRERTVAVFVEAREAWRAHARDVGLVWRSPQRRPWNRETVGNVFRTVCADAGVHGLTFHSLRHFHASWLLDQGASDLDVALQLGHRSSNGTVDPGLVRRVYGHPDVEMGLQRLEAVTG